MLTVLIATHNGQRTLPKVLAAYQDLRSPKQGWRMVIVDNASTDETHAILAAHTAALPLSVITTPHRGKNRALNLALERAGITSLMIFTDDDIIPDAGWLVALSEAADRQPGADIFGGSIVPDWPANRPAWIDRLVPLGATYGLTDAHRAEGHALPTEIWGGNMAVRGELFRAGHRFSESVGPAAGQYIMGSEVEFTCRLAAAGHRCWFVPQAVVAHIIRQEQLARDWIIQRAYRLGRHMYHQERPVVARHATWRGMPRWRLRQLVTERAAQAWSRLRRDGEATFRADWEVSFLQGYLSEARAASGGEAA
jgi:glycosyltransferase involved in cell wall biosynthesis